MIENNLKNDPRNGLKTTPVAKTIFAPCLRIWVIAALNDLVYHPWLFLHSGQTHSNFLNCYFQDFKMRFANKEFTSVYQFFQPVGIPMECAIYQILFVIAKEKVTTCTCIAAFSSWRGIKIKPGFKLQEIRASMDDLNLLNRWRLLSTWTNW